MTKLFKFKDETTPITYFGTDRQVEVPTTYQEKPFRAIWVSNVVNIDLPTTEDAQAYKEKVIKMLDTMVEFNMTAVFFQVRTTNDAFYLSKLNPYSRYLTGKEGKKPPFDVMNFVIEETKKRGLEFHAWCNPYRVSMNSDIDWKTYLEQCDDLNYAKQNPDHVILDTKGQMILNPTKESVKQFIIDSMVELAENYDIDGIHWDDYFYPYAGLDVDKNDLEDFEKRSDPSQTLGDFRRMHVSDVINRVNDAVHGVDKNMRFGVSPFGIWKNSVNDARGSNTDAKCSESYHNQYADAYEWVKKDMVDYIVPQIYWPFGHEIAPFADVFQFWLKTVKGTNVDLYIGLPAYRLGQDGDFENPEEVTNQIKYVNQYDEVQGNVFFTYHTFIDKGRTEPGVKHIKKLMTEAK